jgi:hypothetical protein
MSEAAARKLLRQSDQAVMNRRVDNLDGILYALTLAVQALTEAALCDQEVSVASPPDWVNEGRTAVDEFNDRLRERIGQALDEPLAISDPAEDEARAVRFRDSARLV